MPLVESKVDKGNLDTIADAMKDAPDLLSCMARSLGYQTRAVSRGNLHLLPKLMNRVYNVWGIKFGENHHGDQIVGLSYSLPEFPYDCIILFAPEEDPPRNASTRRKSWVWYNLEEMRDYDHESMEDALDDIWEDFGPIPGEQGRWNLPYPNGWEDDPVDEEEESRRYMQEVMDEEVERWDPYE